MNGALDRCLGRVVSGRASVEDCCRENPAFAYWLEPLLETALAAPRSPGEEVPAGVRDSVWAKIVARAGFLEETGDSGEAALAERLARGASRRSGSTGRRVVRPLALSGAALMLLFSGTAVAAASGADPDSALYPIKERLESVRTELAWSNPDRASAENGHANARLDELQAMVSSNKPEYVPKLLADYQTSIGAAEDYAKAAAENGSDTADIMAAIHATRVRHDELLAYIEDDVPVETARKLRDSMELPAPGSGVQSSPQAPTGEIENRGSGEEGDGGSRGAGGENRSRSGEGSHEDPGNSGGSDSSGSTQGGESIQVEPSEMHESWDSPDAAKKESSQEAMHPQTSMSPGSGMGNSQDR